MRRFDDLWEKKNAKTAGGTCTSERVFGGREQGRHTRRSRLLSALPTRRLASVTVFRYPRNAFRTYKKKKNTVRQKLKRRVLHAAWPTCWYRLPRSAPFPPLTRFLFSRLGKENASRHKTHFRTRRFFSFPPSPLSWLKTDAVATRLALKVTDNARQFIHRHTKILVSVYEFITHYHLYSSSTP